MNCKEHNRTIGECKECNLHAAREANQDQAAMMRRPKKWEDEFEENFPPIECSAHERTSSSLCICEELPDINEENTNFKSFISKTLQKEQERWIEEIEKVKVIAPNVEPPPNGLSQNQIFASGQMNMKMRIHTIITKLKGECLNKR